MSYINFYIGNPENFFKDPNDERLRDLHSVRIKESSNLATGYEVVDTVKLQHGSSYVATHQASEDYINKYYRLEFISDPNVDDEDDITVYFTTEPVLPEVIANVVDDVREWLGDTDLDDPAFEDHEYLQTIRFALRQWRGEKNLTKISEEDMYPLQLLVREAYANILAYDHAKYRELKTPTHSLNKWEIGQHYAAVAESLRSQFEAYARRLNMGSGGYNEDMIITQMPSPKVSTAIRRSRTQGIKITNQKPYFRQRRFIDYPDETV